MKSSPIKLVIVWLIVAIPLGWGVLKSAQKASPLFTTGSEARK